MYFPEDMTFQYFFFSTYIGYFLQALPIALLVSGVYGVLRFGKKRETPVWRKVCACIFVCYLTGLILLVIGLDWMGIFYHNLFYPFSSGREIRWFGGEIDLVPDFFRHISGEVVGNVLMFLPFGVLHPLSCARPTWKKTVLAGLFTVVAIETLQPVFGRAFDVNDILLNGFAIVLSASVSMAARKKLKK